MSGAVGLRARVDQPVVTAIGEPHQVAVLLELVDTGEATWSLPLNLVLAVVGERNGSIARTALDAIAGCLDAADTVRAVTPTGVEADWKSAAAAPHASIADALTAITNSGEEARVLLIADHAEAEPLEPLVSAATGLAEKGRAFDVLCTEPAVELGLLTRLAALGGGELLSASERRYVGPRATRWIERLKSRAMADTRIEFEFASDTQPLQLYRVQPSPLFLGNVRLSGDLGRRLVIDPGVVAQSALPSFILLVEAPPGPRGTRRIADATFIARGSDGTLRDKITVAQEYDDRPTTLPVVDAAVVAARDQVQGCVIVEDVARGYSAGDARRVSMLLEQLVRHYATLDDTVGLDVAYQTRLRFLRTGILGRNVLNRLRRITGAREAG